MNGLLAVNKPSGPTSYDVLRHIKKVLSAERRAPSAKPSAPHSALPNQHSAPSTQHFLPKVGHAGTLDPFAEGVLLVFFGKATKWSPQILEWPKTYRGCVRLGFETDTDDLTGKVKTANGEWRMNPEDSVRDPHPHPLPNGEGKLSPECAQWRSEGEGQKIRRNPSAAPSLERVREAAAKFIGEIEQVPPRYSALHRQGRRYYELARAGIEAWPVARRVLIERLDILGYEFPNLWFEAQVGRGVYLRSIARDLGRRLGCGGHLAQLTRTAVGPFKIEEAVALKELHGGRDIEAGLVTELPLQESLP